MPYLLSLSKINIYSYRSLSGRSRLKDNTGFYFSPLITQIIKYKYNLSIIDIVQFKSINQLLLSSNKSRIGLIISIGIHHGQGMELFI